MARHTAPKEVLKRLAALEADPATKGRYEITYDMEERRWRITAKKRNLWDEVR